MPADSSGKTSLPDLRYIRELARVAKNYDLGEVEIESGEHRILIRRGASPGAPVVVAAPAAAAPTPAPAPAAAVREVVEEVEADYITSPFVGTFYRAPSAEAAAFVEVGGSVQNGQTLCIVEAMKLFNELEAEFPCVIEEVLVENAQPVEYGARLFKVRKL
ncbi:MAG TPA: acetyl-CoA carboxylase biotin carboxyl carrier protein [Nannocystis exedens]|nr:acetyl-CoA carboxylase biotin carboxyl carrier protein [Nannocystis exedens]